MNVPRGQQRATGGRPSDWQRRTGRQLHAHRLHCPRRVRVLPAVCKLCRSMLRGVGEAYWHCVSEPGYYEAVVDTLDTVDRSCPQPYRLCVLVPGVQIGAHVAAALETCLSKPDDDPVWCWTAQTGPRTPRTSSWTASRTASASHEVGPQHLTCLLHGTCNRSTWYPVHCNQDPCTSALPWWFNPTSGPQGATAHRCAA